MNVDRGVRPDNVRGFLRGTSATPRFPQKRQALGIRAMNRRAPAIPAFLILGLLAAAAQPQASVPFDWEKLEDSRNLAHLKSDTSALDALWADDITIVVPGMAPLAKADALKMWRSVPV